MPASEKVLNDFYQGLKLLIEFETGQSRGAMSSPFYAINKVVSHFDKALDDGDVIAPFFLHYIADKFPGYVDKSLLPDLSSVPSHKSKAPIWIKDYQTFLTLHNKIDEHTVPRVIECKNIKQAELNQKNIQRKLESIEKEVVHLMQSTSPIAGVLAAKLLQHLQKKTHNSLLSKLIIAAMEKSAFFPNIFAMYEYAQFLQNEGLRASCPLIQEKLETELSLLENSNGGIKVLLEHYQNQIDHKFLSQWLFQSALHGEIDNAKFMLERYIFDDHMQWYDRISNTDKLEEAIKWFNWYVSHAPLADVHDYWREIAELASNYRGVIGDNKYRASFLCYTLDRINQDLLKQSQTVPKEFFVRQNMDLIKGIENFREIVSLTWSLNNRKLPVGCSSIVINEIATILETHHEYTKAESLYRQVYALDKNHPIHQYNLANILSLQNKNKIEQISLYFDAAKQGCNDSVLYLFRMFVIDGEGTLDNLEKLRQVVQSLNSDLDLEVPAELLIHLITVTIFQQLNNIDAIKWVVTERNGKKFHKPLFVIEEECLDRDAFVLDSSSSSLEDVDKRSSIEPSRTDETTSPHSEFKEKSTVESSSTNSFRLFQPDKKDTKTFDTKKERALKKLHELNNKQIKNLSLNDFIQAKKAYQILIGETEGIELSHKGRTSGSRAKVGSKNIHLTHGRDRMSVGAQSDIKDAISGFCWQIGI